MISKINGFVENEAVKIHYLANNINDTNQVCLLFVPGIMMPAWIWEKQLDYFSKNYNVVAIDPRSQGDSDQASEGHYAFSLAKDIKAVVDKFQLRPLILIGWSLAVPEVINYAAHFASNNLIGLVLVDGLAGIDPSLPFYQETVDYWAQLQIDRIPKTREFIKSIFRQPQTEAYIEKLIETALRTPTNTVMTLIYNYILQDFRSFLPRIDTPTLIATIEGPRLGYMQKMQNLLPHSRLEIFKSAGHALFVDQPERFNCLLKVFIEDVKGCHA
jgi:non-heme chloroperoxidase